MFLVESIASGTSTEPRPTEQVEITFQKETSITYADKLLIKKHRRTELSPVSSPRGKSDEGEGWSPRQEGMPLTNGHKDAVSGIDHHGRSVRYQQMKNSVR